MTESQTTPPSDFPGQPTPPSPPASIPMAPPVPSAPAAPLPGAAPAPASAPVISPAVLDEDSYSALRTPRSASALALDGTWHQISPRYVIAEYVQSVFWAIVLAVAAFVLSNTLHQQWVWIPAGVLLVIIVITMIILPRQARAIGYMLREDDIVFRRGILWQRMVAVPYGRMQLVDITQGPLARAFGISELKMVTAAATTGVQIPGLKPEAAEALRDTLIEVAETRRTGL